MAHTSGLLLRNPPLVERIATLFAELNEDPALQAAFIKAPSEVVGGGALPRASATRQASAVNEFIFSVLGDERLQRWLEKYRTDTNGQDCSVEQKLRDLARAFMEYGTTKLQDDVEFHLGFQYIITHGTTYLRTLNNRVFVITRISAPPKRVEIDSMQVVSMAEQLLHCANTKPIPAEVKAS